MTPEQQHVLSLIDAENTRRGSHSPRPIIMAICQIESAFNPWARRYEPRIGDASYGLMQLLSGTARDLGYTGPCFPNMPNLSDVHNNPSLALNTLYDPALNIDYGMSYLSQGWEMLEHAFGRPPTLSELFAGYNEGYGAAARGRPDPAYVTVAIAALRHWEAELGETVALDE